MSYSSFAMPEAREQHTRWERVNNHVRKHISLYLTGATALAVGTSLLMRNHLRVDVPRVSAREVPRATRGSAQAQSRGFSFALYMRNVGNATATVHTGKKGHPGFVTRCLETGALFPSQNKAAEAMGVSPSVMSGHLSGALGSVNDLHFERVFLQ